MVDGRRWAGAGSAAGPSVPWRGRGLPFPSARPLPDLRRTEAADVGLLAGFLAGLSYGTRYFRFGQGDFDLDEAGLRALCAPSPVHGVSYAAMLDGDAGAGMVAFGGYCIEAGGEGCELALVVADAWQGHGMGRRLVAKLAEDARQRGLQHMCARILVSNQRMLDCARGLGFRIEPWEGSRVVMRAAMVLQPREAAVRCSSA